jgi:hypothetical protein
VSQRLQETTCLIDGSEGLRVALVMRKTDSYVQQWLMSRRDVFTCRLRVNLVMDTIHLHKLYGMVSNDGMILNDA